MSPATAGLLGSVSVKPASLKAFFQSYQTTSAESRWCSVSWCLIPAPTDCGPNDAQPRIEFRRNRCRGEEGRLHVPVEIEAVLARVGKTDRRGG